MVRGRDIIHSGVGQLRCYLLTPLQLPLAYCSCKSKQTNSFLGPNPKNSDWILLYMVKDVPLEKMMILVIVMLLIVMVMIVTKVIMMIKIKVLLKMAMLGTQLNC